MALAADYRDSLLEFAGVGLVGVGDGPVARSAASVHKKAVGGSCIVHFPHLIHSEITDPAVAAAMKRRFGISMGPVLTPFGAELRRRRQATYDRLLAEGRSPHWVDGVRLFDGSVEVDC